MHVPKFRREVEKLLRATGRPWELSHGGKHVVIRLDGRKIGIFSESGDGCDTKKIAAMIKRAC